MGIGKYPYRNKEVVDGSRRSRIVNREVAMGEEEGNINNLYRRSAIVVREVKLMVVVPKIIQHGAEYRRVPIEEPFALFRVVVIIRDLEPAQSRVRFTIQRRLICQETYPSHVQMYPFRAARRRASVAATTAVRGR